MTSIDDLANKIALLSQNVASLTTSVDNLKDQVNNITNKIDNLVPRVITLENAGADEQKFQLRMNAQQQKYISYIFLIFTAINIIIGVVIKLI